MKPVSRLTQVILILVIVGAALTLGFWGGWVESGIRQPIAFPHKTHVDMNLPCTSCHVRAETDAVAGRPPTALCMGCHAGGETTSEEIKKLRAYGEKGQEVPWKRVWRMPSHVFFPHRIHVTGAKISCQTCHGPMETLTKPPTGPLVKLTMDSCMACHEISLRAERAKKKDVAHTASVGRLQLLNDCNTCHR